MVLIKIQNSRITFPRVDNAYLARSTELRSFFAKSAIRGSTRATLQLRSIWTVKDKSENGISQGNKMVHKIR